MCLCVKEVYKILLINIHKQRVLRESEEKKKKKEQNNQILLFLITLIIFTIT